MSRKLDYSVLDVFAERPLEGNPLAVFHDARSLSDEEMQALAREMNLAETTFVLPSDDEEDERRNGVRVRIFTTAEELPFAGHPTLGTASWLHLNYPPVRDAETITLKLNVGPIVVKFDRSVGGEPGVHATMRQNNPVFGATHDRATVARVIGMNEEDLSPDHLPQTVSTGMPFCIVPLRSMEALARLQMSQREAQAYLRSSDAKFFYCIAHADSDDMTKPHWRARMQFYSGEDPATGSACGCCISWLVKHGLVRCGESALVEQGIEIKRPSRLHASAMLQGDEVSEVCVAGRTIPVASGSFFLPRTVVYSQVCNTETPTGTGRSAAAVDAPVRKG
jgi:trans-2,3-dihydro-3-hydroxyanthranilate isomerase